MIYCRHCGECLDDASTYCSKCGKIATDKKQPTTYQLYYHLPITNKRKCDIKVYSQYIVFEGNFMYLKDKEFYRNKQPKDTVFIKNFLGMGYLKKRSYKKCIVFILGGSVLSVIKTIIDKLSELVDKANTILQWIGQSVTLPEWMNITLNMVAAICLLLGVLFFFSKKKVVEISFTDKRICIPQKSLSNAEFAKLYQSLEQLSKG